MSVKSFSLLLPLAKLAIPWFLYRIKAGLVPSLSYMPGLRAIPLSAGWLGIESSHCKVVAIGTVPLRDQQQTGSKKCEGQPSAQAAPLKFFRAFFAMGRLRGQSQQSQAYLSVRTSRAFQPMPSGLLPG